MHYSRKEDKFQVIASTRDYQKTITRYNLYLFQEIVKIYHLHYKLAYK